MRLPHLVQPERPVNGGPDRPGYAVKNSDQAHRSRHAPRQNDGLKRFPEYDESDEESGDGDEEFHLRFGRSRYVIRILPKAEIPAARETGWEREWISWAGREKPPAARAFPGERRWPA